jgi:hypothetical protein
VLYEPNVLGSRGPRKMVVLVPQTKKNGTRKSWRPNNPEEGMIAARKKGDQSVPTLLACLCVSSFEFSLRAPPLSA